MSVFQITDRFIEEKKVSCKYYFIYRPNDIEASFNSEFNYKASFKAGDTLDLKYTNKSNRLLDFDQDDLSVQSGVTYTGKEFQEEKKDTYLEFEMKRLAREESKEELAEYVVLVIRDITNIIKSQQRLSDEMYQDAIEANYSHEQMTPLNCILGNSKLV